MTTIVPYLQAQRHPISHDRPAVNFFSGALLGNGGLGAVVTTRPDAVVVHFGHNNVWDIRVAERNAEAIGTFQQIFERALAVPREYERLDQDAWFKEYLALMAENYAQLYPRPFPCGSLILGTDRRKVEVLNHSLDVSNGVCTVQMLVEGSPVVLELFVDQQADRLWLRCLDEHGQLVETPFERVRLLPDPDGLYDDTVAADSAVTAITLMSDEPDSASKRLTIPETMPERVLAFRQELPFQAPPASSGSHPNDRAFRLTVRLSAGLERRGRANWHGQVELMPELERAIDSRVALIACVQLDEGLASVVSATAGDVADPTQEAYDQAIAASRRSWEEYWNCSGVRLGDQFLERIWYWNQYFLHCAIRPGATCPGLFANWSYRNIGTAWHGDYHMNYNTQQPFWAAFSSNHVEQHLPYVDLVDRLLPLSQRWAREYYGLRGAFFPHSAYPVEMNIMPYPVPTWGWEICETPWTVQSLWWHYQYTQDRAFLEHRAFEPIREATLFLVDYMRRPEAHGPAWGDDRYHIYPTVPPEIYGLMPGLRKNYDCLTDLTLTRFVFKAYLQACRILGREEAERELIDAVQDVLAHFPEYPTAESQIGKVFVSVPGEDPEIVYNVPVVAMTVFPGEEHGLGSSPEDYEVAANSYRNQQLEGGNELVFANLQGVRLGLLDIEHFKRQIRYCLLPNGSCTDMVLQVHGRYSDTTPYDFMGPMGIWLENFALPAVINECLLQSYDGTLRLFPNWPLETDAEFRTLRAVGAFLVSAALQGGEVRWIEIVSEAGAPLRMQLPWAEGAHCMRPTGETLVGPGMLELETSPGETIVLEPR